jgi:hypothetical protein
MPGIYPTRRGGSVEKPREPSSEVDGSGKREGEQVPPQEEAAGLQTGKVPIPEPWLARKRL